MTMPMVLSMGLMLPLTANAAAPYYDLVNMGRDPDGPVVLVVASPGLSRSEYATLVFSLEEVGLDAWVVTLRSSAPPSDAGASQAWQDVLPRAVTDLRAQDMGASRLALAGHGFGGTMAFLAASFVEPPPISVALLGAPLGAAPSELTRWLADQPVSPLVTVPDPAVKWRDHYVLHLLWGDPLPLLEPLRTDLAATFLAWLQTGVPIDPKTIHWPVLATAGAMDRLAPPESVFGPALALPDAQYVRFGMLRLDPEDPEHGDLLREERYTSFVARWIWEKLR